MERTPEPPDREESLDPALAPPAWAARLPTWAWFVAFAAALWSLRALGLAFTDRPGGVAVVWPAAGLVLYALLVTRRRTWPLVLALAFGLGVVGALRYGRPPGQAVAFNAAEVLRSVAAGWLVIRLGGRPTLRTLRGTLVIVLAPAVALAALSAVAYALLSGQPAFAERPFWIFWTGSSLGIVLVTSLLVEWSEPPATPAGPHALLSALGMAATFAVGLALLGVPGLPVDDVVLLPPMLWAAVRFGARGATVAIAAGTAAFLVGGPWPGSAAGSAAVAAGKIATQVFIGVGAASILAVAAVGEERRAAERRRLLVERRAEEASRLAALGTLAAGVAHEINNPLSYVVSNLAHVKEKVAALPDLDGAGRAGLLEPLSDAEEGARRVRDIVRQLHALARPEEAVAPVDPARALRAALAMAQGEIGHRARLSTELAATPAVLASEGRLTQVFVSLLVNAAQAIPEGNAAWHEVRAVLFPRGGEVVAEISDTGRGMSLETRARIFEPFYTTREPGGGPGLGLAVSHTIVTGMGGRIEVDTAPGAGSRFRVVLPAVGAGAPSSGG